MQRTNTTRQRVFKPAGQDGPIFDFSRPHDIRITVPKESNWRSESHWHNTESSCISINCLQGYLKVFCGGGSYRGGEGSRYPLQREGLHSWSSDSREEDLIVLLTVNETNEILYRNKFSAILDADRLPFLASTSIWLRALFRLALVRPPVYRWLLKQMLWVQLQAMNYAHDYLTFHGSIPFVAVWRVFHILDIQPPRWVAGLQWKSRNFFTKVVQGGCFWLGKSVGIQGQYPEYTPRHQELEKEHTEC